MTSALVEYERRRSSVGRGRLPAGAVDCVRAQLEAIGPAATLQWWRACGEELQVDWHAEAERHA